MNPSMLQNYDGKQTGKADFSWLLLPSVALISETFLLIHTLTSAQTSARPSASNLLSSCSRAEL